MKKINKKYVLIFLLGVIISQVISVSAELIIGASEVAVNSTHTNKTTVKDSLDEIYTTLDDEKSNIINSLNTKGLELGLNSSYAQIVNGIDSLPFGKTDDGSWGFEDNTGNVAPVKTGLKILGTISNSGTINVSTTLDNYSSLTSDDFIVEITGVTLTQSGTSGDNNTIWLYNVWRGTVNGVVTKSYDASTGVLTVNLPKASGGGSTESSRYGKTSMSLTSAANVYYNG